MQGADGRHVSSSRAHGRRDTNAYPPTPNTTGIIINIPNTVLIIDFSIPLCPLRSGAPEFNDYVRGADNAQQSAEDSYLGPDGSSARRAGV